jgi:hypothetical protein
VIVDRGKQLVMDEDNEVEGVLELLDEEGGCG